ncbi:Serine/threonine-protein kinase RAD53 [Cladobotryum mycophilum]|uniref:Autophagy-related protein 1 n=1 Tax=Cladobotryum mycophilum TaxID=491253 RepID=A0ABR0S7Q6_9HYPO
MPPFPENRFSDLVRDSKIETEVHDACIQHTFYESGLSARKRLIRREERWARESCLGQGAYGRVYLERCVHGTEQKLRAVKEVKKFVVPGQDLEYLRELEAIIKFSNPRYAHCFVRSYGWFEIGDSVFIAMEYLRMGDLQRYLTRPLPESEARQITTQVLEGLGFMHENGFVHRDVKPGNIMVVTAGPDWFVKIADFGISKRRQQDVTSLRTPQRGTVGFAAPESLGFSQESTATYTYSVDMWSLGTMVYRMLANTLPFQNIGDMFKYVNGMLSFPSSLLEKHNVSEQGQDLIVKLMSPNPQHRPAAALAMEHDWVSLHLDIADGGSKSREAPEDPLSDDETRQKAGSLPITEVFDVMAEPTWASAASKAWSEVSTNRMTFAMDKTIRSNRTSNHPQQPSVKDAVDDDLGRQRRSTITATLFEETTIKPSQVVNYQSPSIEDVQDESEIRNQEDYLPVDWSVPLELSTEDCSGKDPCSPSSVPDMSTTKERLRTPAPKISSKRPQVVTSRLENDYSSVSEVSLSSNGSDDIISHDSDPPLNSHPKERPKFGASPYVENYSDFDEFRWTPRQDRSINGQANVKTKPYIEEYSDDSIPIKRSKSEGKTKISKPYIEEYSDDMPGSRLKSGGSQHTTYGSEVTNQWSASDTPVPLYIDSDSATDESSEFVNCDSCNWKFDFSSDPIELLTCGHYMCYRCLFQILTLSLVSPMYMPPRCCSHELGVIGVGNFKRLNSGTDFKNISDAWHSLKRLKKFKWKCPRGHPPRDGSLLVTNTQTAVWKQEDLEHSSDPYYRYNEYCLFCSKMLLGEGTCRCRAAQAITNFIDKLNGTDVFQVLTPMSSQIKNVMQIRTKMTEKEHIEYQTLDEMERKEELKYPTLPKVVSRPPPSPTPIPPPPPPECYACRAPMEGGSERIYSQVCRKCTRQLCSRCGSQWGNCNCFVYNSEYKPDPYRMQQPIITQDREKGWDDAYMYGQYIEASRVKEGLKAKEGLKRSPTYIREQPPASPTPPPVANQNPPFAPPDEQDDARRFSARPRRGSTESSRMQRGKTYRKSSRGPLDEPVLSTMRALNQERRHDDIYPLSERREDNFAPRIFEPAISGTRRASPKSRNPSPRDRAFQSDRRVTGDDSGRLDHASNGQVPYQSRALESQDLLRQPPFGRSGPEAIVQPVPQFGKVKTSKAYGYDDVQYSSSYRSPERGYDTYA